MIRNRHFAWAMLLCLQLPLFAYVLTNETTFLLMSDRFRVGTFPLLFLGLSTICLLLLAIDGRRNERLKETAQLSAVGILRILIVTAGGLLFAFYHDQIGFLLAGLLLLILIGLCAGLRTWPQLLGYGALVTLLVFGLFLLIGFDPPPIGRLAWTAWGWRA